MYRVGQKNRTCLSVDNSATVTRRKACYMSKVLEYCRQKGPNLHSKSFKYFLPNLHKSSLPLKLSICLHYHVPEFIKLKSSLPKFCELFSVGAFQKIAWAQNFSNWPAKMHAKLNAGLRWSWTHWFQRSISCLKGLLVMNAKAGQLPMSDFI